MLNEVIPDLLFDLWSAGEAFEDMKQTGLSGALLPQPQGRATGALEGKWRRGTRS